MPEPLKNRITLSDLRAARKDGRKIPMLTCYDYTTAGLMQEAGVPTLLVGDSAANVILGYDTTVRVPLGFMIEIAAAVRRGAPLAFVIADMPFGSYQASAAQGVKNVSRMLKYSGCDAVKLEVGPSHMALVQRLADAGVAVMAHLGLRPQSVHLMGGYKYQGRTVAEAQRIVDLAGQMEQAGAAMLLLEAVPSEVAERVVERTQVPVIGCGAGPACHGSVFVTHDALGLSVRPPRFAPSLGNLAGPMRDRFAEYVRRVACGEYPAPEHGYPMPEEEKAKFLHGTGR